MVEIIGNVLTRSSYSNKRVVLVLEIMIKRHNDADNPAEHEYVYWKIDGLTCQHSGTR